jgi:hypothetical protein
VAGAIPGDEGLLQAEKADLLAWDECTRPTLAHHDLIAAMVCFCDQPNLPVWRVPFAMSSEMADLAVSSPLANSSGLTHACRQPRCLDEALGYSMV